jgi:hypothetical protein
LVFILMLEYGFVFVAGVALEDAALGGLSC